MAEKASAELKPSPRRLLAADALVSPSPPLLSPSPLASHASRSAAPFASLFAFLAARASLAPSASRRQALAGRVSAQLAVRVAALADRRVSASRVPAAVVVAASGDPPAPPLALLSLVRHRPLVLCLGCCVARALLARSLGPRVVHATALAALLSVPIGRVGSARLGDSARASVLALAALLPVAAVPLHVRGVAPLHKQSP